MGALEVSAMADRRSHDCRVRSMGRMEARAARAGSASYASERLLAELRELGGELIDEPIPPHLVAILRSTGLRKRRKQRSPRRTRGANSS